MAKCLVSNTCEDDNDGDDSNVADRRLSVLEAARHLKRAEVAFRDAGDFQRVKDVLYMTVG